MATGQPPNTKMVLKIPHTNTTSSLCQFWWALRISGGGPVIFSKWNAPGTINAWGSHTPSASAISYPPLREPQVTLPFALSFKIRQKNNKQQTTAKNSEHTHVKLARFRSSGCRRFSARKAVTKGSSGTCAPIAHQEQVPIEMRFCQFSKPCIYTRNHMSDSCRASIQ